jgi:hypothetical protein
LSNCKSYSRGGQSSGFVPVYNSRGKKVGVIRGDNLEKRVRRSKHFLRMYQGWALDNKNLADARRLGVKRIIIIDGEQGVTYEACLEDFFSEKAIPVHLGAGPQTCLPEIFWNSYETKPKRSSRQKEL